MQADNWWAVGVPTEPPMILFHPLQPKTRLESSVMHEISHLILGHKPERLMPLVGSFVGRDYPKQNEEEARYLGSCLQISEPGIDWSIQRRLTLAEIAKHFGASQRLVQYRLNMTGRRL
jgi:Zn-dependent peptidase ImmA (M78 family)